MQLDQQLCKGGELDEDQEGRQRSRSRKGRGYAAGVGEACSRAKAGATRQCRLVDRGNVDQLPSHKCLSLCNAIQFAQDQHSLPRTCSTCTAHALLVRYPVSAQDTVRIPADFLFPWEQALRLQLLPKTSAACATRQHHHTHC